MAVDEKDNFSPRADACARARSACRRRAVANRARGGSTRAVGQNLDELFDVVDEHDRVIGQAPRHEVHARGLRHRAVHIFVVNRAGEIFLHQRSLAKDTFPGCWNSSCAGHVAAGDDYDTTVWRELDEELEAFGFERYPVTQRLRQVPGVGPLTALAFVLTI